jgi:putative CocE/NonD family hydrolase
MSDTSVRIDTNVEMKTRDGVVLRADVYRPDIASPVPAIAMRTPYDKGVTARTASYLPVLTAVQAGFAVVVQDIRGRFASEGEWDLVHLHAANVDDGYDCIEWIASEPWCDGNLGMMGGSYVGVTQLAAAAAKPPSLRAIAPWLLGMAPARAMAHSLPLESMTVGWMAGLAVDLLMKKMATGEADAADFQTLVEAMVDPAATAGVLPLDDLLNLRTPGMPSYAEVDEMLRHANAQIEATLATFEVPALWCFGWYDNAGGTEQFGEMRAAPDPAAREGTRMIIGAWTHNYALNFVGSFGLGALGDAIGGGVPQSHLKFFGRHLRGDDTDIPVVRYFVLGANVWKEADDWPVPGTDVRSLYLRSGGNANSATGDGALSWDAPGPGEPADSYDYDPMDPVPSWGFRVMYTGGTTVNGPYEQTRVERRPDVLVFTSEPLTEPLEVVGDVTLHVWVSSSTPDTDVVAKLCVVDRHGVSTNIADGFLRTRFRTGWKTPELLTPGEAVELEVELGATGYRLEAGERLRVQVTSSAFPHLARNLNTGNPIHEDSPAEGVVATVTVLHDADHPSFVALPVQPAAPDLRAERLERALALLPEILPARRAG